MLSYVLCCAVLCSMLCCVASYVMSGATLLLHTMLSRVLCWVVLSSVTDVPFLLLAAFSLLSAMAWRTRRRAFFGLSVERLHSCTCVQVRRDQGRGGLQRGYHRGTGSLDRGRLRTKLAVRHRFLSNKLEQQQQQQPAADGAFSLSG